MRILFQLTMTSLVRHFESVVLTLARRGHTIRIATPGQETNWPLPEALAAHPGVSEVVCPANRGQDEWAQSAPLFRLLVDYLRYLEPPFAGAQKLRDRARTELLDALTDRQVRRLIARCPSCDTKIVNDALVRALLSDDPSSSETFAHLRRAIERAIPPPPAYRRFLEAERPDVVLVTPLVALGSDQADWVKSARSLGIPVGFPVFSWDNLTTKGVMHEQPDQIFVWNDIQKREAVDYHGAAPDSVAITGAPRFDPFLELTPKRDRQTYCAKYGLDPSRPIIAYLCSSDFVAEGESAFVRRWIADVRQDAALAGCNIVIRPHPRSEHQWAGVDLTAFPRVALARPKAMNADRSLYETLCHSAVVVGLNTSAQIEAALLDKPVLTLLAPGFEDGQQGTLHFRYLLEADGGFVRVARDFAEHRRHLADAVEGRYDLTRVRAFAQRFVRPAGLDRPATPLLADAIERLRPASSFGAVIDWLRPARSRGPSPNRGEGARVAFDRLQALQACLTSLEGEEPSGRGCELHADCPSCGAVIADGQLARFTLAVGPTGIARLRELLRLAAAAITAEFERHPASVNP